MPLNGRVTQQYYDASISTGYRPIYLVELLHAGRYYATRPFHDGGYWTCADGLVSGIPQATSGSRRPTWLTTIGSIGQLSVSVDDDGRARIGNTTIELLNQDLAGTFADELVLEHTLVRILQGFEGGGYRDFLPLMTGVIDRAEVTYDTLRLDIVDGSFRKYRDLTTPLGGQYFPGTPVANRGRAIPILFGRRTNVRTIQVTGDARGTLATAMTLSQTYCDLAELDAPFPASGEISIGSETGVAYSSRSYVTLRGITYLRLSGLERAAGTPLASTHAAEEAVVLTSVTYTYLIGYAIGELLNAREDGTLIDPGDFTFTPKADGADSPVSTMTFSTEQTALTVDVQDDPGLVIAVNNGDFETGDSTGWTVTGAALNITTGDTAEGLGTYKAELTADVADTDGTMVADIGVRPNQRHILSFWYRDPVDIPNDLTNGNFDTGSLSPWVLDVADHGTISAAGVMSYTPTPDEVSLKAYSVSIYQDVTVVLNNFYRVEVRVGSNDFREFIGVWQGVDVRISVSLGTPADPILYHNLSTQYPTNYADTYYASSHYPVYKDGIGARLDPRVLQSWGHGPTGDFFTYWARAWRSSGSQDDFPVIQATAGTTLRVTLRADVVGIIDRDTFEAPTPSQTSWERCGVFAVAGAANSPRIVSGFDLGTSADPTQYETQTLPQAPDWTPVGVRFTPTTSTARLTLRTQWNLLQQPSHYDTVAVQLGRVYEAGRNPIDVMLDILATFLPNVDIDTAAFETARETLTEWSVGAYLPDPGESRTLLADLATQSASRLYENGRGELSISVFTLNRAPLLALTPTEITEEGGLVVYERLSTDTIFSTIRVYWGKIDAALGDEAQNFQGLMFADPTQTSAVDTTLSSRCRFAQEQYRRTQTLTVYASFLTDAQTAERLLRQLVDQHTVLRHRVVLTTWLQAAPLDLYDVVDVQHPVIASNSVLTCEVRGKTVDPQAQTVTLELLELRKGDVDEDWEYDPIIVETSPVDEEWEE